MATTTTTPTTTIATTSWLKTHERLIIVALFLLAGYFGLNHYLNNAAAASETRAKTAEAALVSQQTQNTQLAAQSASVLAQYQAMVTALSAQNSSLAAAAASRQVSVVAQQKTDATLPVADLANRLKTLGNAPEGSVSTLGNQIDLTSPGAVAITQTLETIPALTSDLKDTQAALGATQAAQAKADEVIADQTKQITGLNLASVDQTKACTAQVAAVKAEGRKNSMKWFKRGFGLGFLSGLLAGHAVGI
jgi:septal ring factor EnvC (AmiA/AmiB activator)